ncbi:hypothetical protein NDU88_001219 [Pleurodeles waltl]|uniref:Uncharacterized protein n=1 Tax=Pleurodeles waltl TaxID=8319 RepID=A0AAV7V767_PLEWA|nr:hypothetical protein NDU88_001219 [Pleurodeles waltl]
MDSASGTLCVIGIFPMMRKSAAAPGPTDTSPSCRPSRLECSLSASPDGLSLSARFCLKEDGTVPVSLGTRGSAALCRRVAICVGYLSGLFSLAALACGRVPLPLPSYAQEPLQR